MADRTAHATQAWIEASDTLDVPLTASISNVVSHAVDMSGNLIHVVNLDGGGYVITSGDDYDEPSTEYANCGWVGGVTWTPNQIIVPAAVTGTTDIEVPPEWPEGFAGFAKAFGNDKEAAMCKPTGKMSASGNPMYVWQDYVAGTDPTDLNSRFSATISISNGVPYISWSPDLNTNGVVRKYTILGKESLTDAADWSPQYYSGIEKSPRLFLPPENLFSLDFIGAD